MATHVMRVQARRQTALGHHAHWTAAKVNETLTRNSPSSSHFETNCQRLAPNFGVPFVRGEPAATRKAYGNHGKKRQRAALAG
ncbi:MAG: hypothetical protein ACLQNV_25155, partial [Steroidobacteraceae bacterium]